MSNCVRSSLLPTVGSRGLGLATATTVLVVATTWIGRAASGGGDGMLPIGTTGEDFFQPGTQPMTPGFGELLSVNRCGNCHGDYNIEVEPFRPWAASMLGQAARDPVFWAAVDVANQDATDAGQFCIRCHAPVGFLRGHALPANGADLDELDEEGVGCNFCHRVVNPVYAPGESPIEDVDILNGLAGAGLLPRQGSNARYIVDPADSRRGPFDDVPMNPHIGVPQPEILVSPFHQSSEICWNCHDVSNPMTTLGAGGVYQMNNLNEPHPSADQNDMFPLHRTYREWQNSYYNLLGGVQHNGRFGGNHPTGVMNTCTDCHMPDMEGEGCNLGSPYPTRPDVPQHAFIGSNTWVLNAVRSLFPDGITGLSAQSVADAIARNVNLLEGASDLELSQVQSVVRARVINQSGHKLPTGLPDGRRIWINTKFFDGGGGLLAEHGAYDFGTATLTANDTTVFECRLGLDAAQSALTGLPQGESFHFVLTNEVIKDNRIPPQGFSLTIAEQDQTMPVGVVYLNGQHWHDTDFPIPEGAVEAVITVYYQLTSREFIEFLRDEGGVRGEVAYDQWVLHGMSQPVVMDMALLALRSPADINDDGTVDVLDLLLVLEFWGACPSPTAPCPPDINNDGVIDVLDLLILLANWGS